MIEMPTDEQVARMLTVFDMVKPVGNWKAPINVEVPKGKASAEEIRDAVAFYCGGYPVVEDKGETLLVTGEGYYGWIGA